MNETEEYESILSQWLVGMNLASFEYAGVFSLQFEQSGRVTDKPKVLRLDILAKTYINDMGSWNSFVHSLPIKDRRTEKDHPAFAYRLMVLIGATIIEVELKKNRTLVMKTSDGEDIAVLGEDDVWDDSWWLYEPDDVAKGNEHFVTCSSRGELYSSEIRKL